MRTRLFIFMLAIFLFQGCGMWYIAYDNIENSVFHSPEKVKNKIKEPVRDSVKIAALWSGHSTMLIQIYDKVILTDPFLNNHLMGFFERRIEAGLDINYLSKLDLLLISHAHSDHSSFASLDMIEEKFPGTDLIFPEGAEDYLPDMNFNMHRVISTEPNSGVYIQKSITVNSLKITPVYAVHGGGRYFLDTYTWKLRGVTGYIIQYKDATVYFAGDTGYDDKAFKEIGKNFNIDVAFIPIGPCRECAAAGFWHHTSSIEALKLFRDINAKFMIPIHYGTLKYIRNPDQPLNALKEILNNSAAGFSDLSERVIILKEGEQKIWK